MRTRLGKLTSVTTGMAPEKMTWRDKWIYENAIFLQQHIDQQRKSSVSCKVNIDCEIENIKNESI